MTVQKAEHKDMAVAASGPYVAPDRDELGLD